MDRATRTLSKAGEQFQLEPRMNRRIQARAAPRPCSRDNVISPPWSWGPQGVLPLSRPRQPRAALTRARAAALLRGTNTFHGTAACPHAQTTGRTRSVTVPTIVASDRGETAPSPLSQHSRPGLGVDRAGLRVDRAVRVGHSCPIPQPAFCHRWPGHDVGRPDGVPSGQSPSGHAIHQGSGSPSREMRRGGPDAPVEQLAYAPEGDVLVVRSSTSTTFYDVADPADPVPLTTVPTNPGEDGLVLLDDGTLLSTARMTATGVDTESLPVHVIVTPLAVSSSAVVTPDRQTWPSSALWATSKSGTSPIRCTRSSANRSVASRSVSAASPSPMTERFWQSGPLPASPSCGIWGTSPGRFSGSACAESAREPMQW